MKIKENITLYECDFCKRKMQIKNAMIKHELHCSKNPKNISACGGCNHLEEGEVEYIRYYSDYNGNPVEYTATTKSFYCKFYKKELYPYKVVKLGHLEKYPESFEGMVQMPTSCEQYNYFL